MHVPLRTCERRRLPLSIDRAGTLRVLAVQSDSRFPCSMKMLEVQRSTLQAENSVPTWHTFLRRGEFGTFLERRLWPVLVFRALIRNSWRYLQLHAAVPAVTRRVSWPASNASTPTCGYRFWQVSFLTLPALHLRHLHVTLTSPTRNRDRIGTRVRIAPSSERTLRQRQYQQPEGHGRILERPTSATPAAMAIAMRSSSSAGRESYGGCALGAASPNGASEFFSLAFRRCPIDGLRRLCHALSKNLRRSSLPSAADLGHAFRDVERFHRGIWTELGLLGLR